MFLLRNKIARSLLHILSYILTYPLYLLGFCIPKNKNLIIIGNIFGYKDSARYLYEYLEDNQKYQAVWIYRNKAQKIPSNAYYYLSLFGIYYQYCAGIAVMTTGFGDLAKFTLAAKKRVQLWHGIPIKKILLDSKETTPFQRSKIFSEIYYKLLATQLNRYHLITAANVKNQALLRQAFGVTREKVIVTGLPRHDRIKAAEEDRKEMLKNILFAPTWRSDLSDASKTFSWLQDITLNAWLAANNISIHVSIHPLNASIEDEITFSDNIKRFSGSDINQSLADYQVLITDYSSIAFDFDVLHRPVIFFCPDLEEYTHERGLYEDYQMLLKEKSILTAEQIVKTIITYQFDDSKNYLNESFMADGKACERIIKEIEKL